MISPLKRSDASALAAVALSCDLSRATASSSAAESVVVSARPDRPDCCRWRAAEKMRNVANISRPDRAPTMPVSPRNARALVFMRMSSASEWPLDTVGPANRVDVTPDPQAAKHPRSIIHRNFGPAQVSERCALVGVVPLLDGIGDIEPSPVA